MCIQAKLEGENRKKGQRYSRVKRSGACLFSLNRQKRIIAHFARLATKSTAGVSAAVMTH